MDLRDRKRYIGSISCFERKKSTCMEIIASNLLKELDCEHEVLLSAQS